MTIEEQIETCKLFILSYLNQRPYSIDELITLAQSHSPPIDRLTLQIASRQLDLVSVQFKQGRYWGLPPQPAEDGEQGLVVKARSFLIEFLSDGPQSSTAIYEACKTRNICSMRTLQTAKTELVETYKSGNKWFWKLLEP